VMLRSHTPAVLSASGRARQRDTSATSASSLRNCSSRARSSSSATARSVSSA
jgi:hypothetical protein